MVRTKFTTTYRRLFTMRFITVDCLLISTILIASELRFVSNKGTDIISPQNRHADVGFEVQRNFIKWKRERPKTMDHWGSSYLIMVKPQWMVNGLWLGCFALRTVTTKSLRATDDKIPHLTRKWWISDVQLWLTLDSGWKPPNLKARLGVLCKRGMTEYHKC